MLGDTLTLVLLDLVYILLTNLITILFYLVSILRARKGHHSWIWYACGTAMGGLYSFGKISMFIRTSKYLLLEDILSIIVFVILAISFFSVLREYQKTEQYKSALFPDEDLDSGKSFDDEEIE